MRLPCLSLLLSAVIVGCGRSVLDAGDSPFDDGSGEGGGGGSSGGVSGNGGKSGAGGNPQPVTCGNGVCDEKTENCTTCPKDCGLCQTCPNGKCDAGETCSSCPHDCGVCETCGDGF